MRRVSHPGMKKGQRKYRRLSAGEQWLEDQLTLAAAKALLNATPESDPRYEELKRATDEFEASLNDGAADVS